MDGTGGDDQGGLTARDHQVARGRGFEHEGDSFGTVASKAIQ